MNTIASIQTLRASARRPLVITVLCILGLIAAAANVPAIFSDAARHVGPWFPAFLAFSVIVTAICMIGLWKMRRWAVYAYTALALVATAMAFALGAWNLTALLVRVTMIALMFSQFSKMR